MAKTTEALELENLGSIITIKGTSACLGYLMDFKEKGIFCPSYGEVSRYGVTPENAEAHNKALDEAMLKGLDENCKIGEHGSFYLCGGKGRPYAIKTFLGTLVADESTGGVHVKTTKRINRFGECSLSVWFWRGGKQYSGRTIAGADLLNFKRVK